MSAENMWACTHRHFLGLKLDAQTALNYVTADPYLSKTHIVRTCLDCDVARADSVSDSLWPIHRWRSCDRPCKPQSVNSKPLASHLFLYSQKVLDPLPDPRKYVHISPSSDSQCSSAPLSVFVSVPPKVGIGSQDSVDTA